MNQHLCRAERINDREMIKGHVLIIHGQQKNQESHCIADLGYPTTYHQVDPETVKRLSGIKDKNNVEIVEGDSVKFGKYIYEVIYEFGSFCLFDPEGRMIEKIGGINDHCYTLFNLAIECCWKDYIASDLEVVKHE